MRLGFAAFSAQGYALAQRLAQVLGGTATRCGVDCPLRDWIREAFSRYEGLVFVGAVGIAVRAIAPYVQSKTTDPAVVVVDEGGRFVIPLLSGHLGGANGLAHRIAAAGGGSPVITTATDGRGLFAVDSWAKEQNCHVMEPERIKGVSGKLLEGETIWMRCPWAVSGLQPGKRGIVMGRCPFLLGRTQPFIWCRKSWCWVWAAEAVSAKRPWRRRWPRQWSGYTSCRRLLPGSAPSI